MLMLLPVTFLLMSSLQFEVNSFESKGFYAVTGSAYINMVTADYKTHYNPQLYYYPNDTSNVRGALLCLRQCLYQFGCHSFIQKPSTRACILLDYDRCNSQYERLTFEKDAITFDVISHEDGGWMHIPCFDICLNQSDCSQCASRYHCTGLYCENCPFFCWQLSPLINGSTKLIVYFYAVYTVTCDQEWQLVWKKGYFKDYAQIYESGALKIRVNVLTTTGQNYVAFYDHVDITGGNMTVGNYLPDNSTIADGWGAPFTGRVMVYIEGSSYLPFFYDSGLFQTVELDDPSVINTTETHANYLWNADAITDNHLVVNDFELYVTGS